MVLAFLVATAVLSAKPTFQDVLKKFPAATLPLTIKQPAEQRVALTPADVDALGFMKDTSPSLAALRKWKEKPYPGDEGLDAGKKLLWPVAAIQRSKSLALLVRYEHLEHMFQTRETFLLSYDSKGALLGGILFHALNGGEAGGELDASTLAEDGAISRLITSSYPLHEAAMPDELVVTSEQRAKLTAAGTLEVMPTVWSSRDGLFVDRKSKEELLAVGKRIFYRAEATKPSQELERDGDTVRFKGSPKPYVLTWNDRLSELTCKNPDGRLQVFTREW